MVPLDSEAIEHVLGMGIDDCQVVSLRHALIHRRPGLQGDRARRPRSVVLVRDLPSGARHAFGAGEAEPAVSWLARAGRPFSLLAPTPWEGALRRLGGPVGRSIVETWVRPDTSPARADNPAIVRRLGPDDAPAFDAFAPDWALAGWGSYPELIARGAAFGVSSRDGALASAAWIFEADARSDALAVATDPRYRRLGLGRASAGALVEHVEAERRRSPAWTTAGANVGSKALARSLGFSPRAREVVLSWGPGASADFAGGTGGAGSI